MKPPADSQTEEVPDAQPPPIRKSALAWDRIWMGLGTILYQSEEVGFQAGPVPTALVRWLGGDDRHLGVLGSFATLGNLGQLLGTPLLRRTNSYRRAMVLTLLLGAAFCAALAAMVCLGQVAALRSLILPLFLALYLMFAPVTGLQSNIEHSWIGDLVPSGLLGWFTKIKWTLGVFGFLIFSLGIARFSEIYPGVVGFAAIFTTFAVSFALAAVAVYSRVTDARPHLVRYLGRGIERPNYRSPVFWWLVVQGLLWTVGRNVGFAFMSAYLIERFHYSLTKIALLVSLQQASSMVVIMLIGNRTDRWGARRPLMCIMSGVALSMALWILSAYWGIGCIIAYYILNGAAGQTLTMLGNNYSLEIFPAKGRAAYIALSRTIGGVAGFGLVLGSGWLVHGLRDFQICVAGQFLGRYHAAFAAGMAIALLSQIPFFIIGDRKVAVLQ